MDEMMFYNAQLDTCIYGAPDYILVYHIFDDEDVFDNSIPVFFFTVYYGVRLYNDKIYHTNEYRNITEFKEYVTKNTIFKEHDIQYKEYKKFEADRMLINNIV